eukprot:SAG11_NODE_9836_length_877_cov_1.239075_1_plen_29_part_10
MGWWPPRPPLARAPNAPLKVYLVVFQLTY